RRSPRLKSSKRFCGLAPRRGWPRLRKLPPFSARSSNAGRASLRQRGSRQIDGSPERVSLVRDDFSLNHHPALALCLSMIFFRKPVPTFRDHALRKREHAPPSREHCISPAIENCSLWLLCTSNQRPSVSR